MIFRRISKALRRQDWAVVLIEFILVIAGVLIALQVDNWNEARLERSLEAGYLDNLDREAEAALQPLQELFDEKQGHLSALDQVIARIDAGDAQKDLTPEQCLSIFESHIYNIGTRTLPTIEELFATGRISILRNEDLRSAIVTFQQSFSARESRRANIQGGRIIARHYADFIQLPAPSTAGSDSDTGGHPTCRADRLIGNPGLRNDLIDNRERLFANTHLLIRHELKQLQQIRRLLDETSSEAAR